MSVCIHYLSIINEDDILFFDCSITFYFSFIEFHCTFYFSYKMLPYYVYYYCIWFGGGGPSWLLFFMPLYLFPYSRLAYLFRLGRVNHLSFFDCSTPFVFCELNWIILFTHLLCRLTCYFYYCCISPGGRRWIIGVVFAKFGNASSDSGSSDPGGTVGASYR